MCIHILGRQLWLGYRKNILSVPHSFCSINDFKSELSLDTGRLKVLDLILTTPIWWWVVRRPNYVNNILDCPNNMCRRAFDNFQSLKRYGWGGGEGSIGK